MRKILGKVYMSDKEAAERYGFSRSWFQDRRQNELEPHYIKLLGKGKVFYPVDETDKWFSENLKRY